MLPAEMVPPVAAPDAAVKDVSAAVRMPRIAIENVQPAVDGGRFAAKCTAGANVDVTADIVIDGHQIMAAVVMWRAADAAEWNEVRMANVGNDLWTATFPAERVGRYEFTVEAWLDEFATFRDELRKKHAASAPLLNEVEEGVAAVEKAAARSGSPALRDLAAQLRRGSHEDRVSLLLDADSARLMAAVDQRPFRARYEPALPIDAERQRASFASWYELFPRSQSNDARRHGTFADVIARLPAIRDMGFDVLYLPPIHPIGKINRKGRNNALVASERDPGSPYAIGSSEGGHDAIHPQLGTLEEFRALCSAAMAHDMEVALDFAIQCSPDHPWLRKHPEWFDWRPDGTIRYAENPPKRYEDIVNVDFYAPGAMPSLWEALRDVVMFWVEQGVHIFRVDNPHTKPLAFWQWMIGEVRGRNPEVMFLAEAFTRPKMMYRLAKVGFSQSYTYFTWRDTAPEMREYLTELTTSAPRHFFRPHFFVNTPDINPLFLQRSGRPGFLIRAALAATLSGLWGIYSGFELCEADALEGREEYANSEKYEIREWDWSRPGNIIDEIRMLNGIRRKNPALHSHLTVRFLGSVNDTVLCFCKATPELDNIIFAAVSFDPAAVQVSQFDLPPSVFGVTADIDLVAEDLVRGGASGWRTGTRQIRLDPNDLPFEIWRLRPAP